MRNFEIFYLPVGFLLFTSAHFSNAGRVSIPNADSFFQKTAAIETLFVKEPNQNSFTKYFMAKRLFMGIHPHWDTFSFYEAGATDTIFTFQRTLVDFENFHSKSMSFRVTDEADTYHFRVVFSANKITLDTIYLYLSFYTGFGQLNAKMRIMKVEKYVRTDRSRDSNIQEVEDLQPAIFHYQKLESGRPSPKKSYLYKITPFTPDKANRKLPRLVFRTGSFKIGTVNNKVVLALAGFEECFYILHLKDAINATTFLGFFYGTGDEVSLDIAGDLRAYLESSTRYESSSQADGEDPRTLQLAHWGVKHSRGGQGSSRNVRSRSSDEESD